MAYVGNPIDTTNTFQSLVGKRFNGDGSTTAFTLDVAPSSTLDIEVFVGNVRQDPNSAYTLSGTTLTFTGAPPSGTNNIYVVHQAKSVGTIDVPDDIISGKTLVTLDNSNDHVLIEDATDGELKKALIPAASFAGIDDQTSSNDDQLTITDTAVIINEDSDDVDFRVESNGNANMLTVNGGSNLVGIASDPDQGSGLHIKISDTSASASSDHDQLVIEKNGDMGIQLLGSASAGCFLSFGDSGDADAGRIGYDHNTDNLIFRAAAGNRARFDSSGRLLINTASNVTGEGFLQVKGATNLSAFQVESNGLVAIRFFNASGSGVGDITVNASGTVFNTSSDYRLKENESLISDGITRLKQLKPYRFNFKTETDKTLDGFFAHEVSSVVPEAITGKKDETETFEKVVLDSNGNVKASNVEQSDWTKGKTAEIYENDTVWEATKTVIKPQSIDQSKLVPLLTAALQEAVAKIEALEARVTTLEG